MTLTNDMTNDIDKWACRELFTSTNFVINGKVCRQGLIKSWETPYEAHDIYHMWFFESLNCTGCFFCLDCVRFLSNGRILVDETHDRLIVGAT